LRGFRADDGQDLLGALVAAGEARSGGGALRRRLAKEDKRLCEASGARIYAAMSRIMARRLTRA
jgi:hypothetical protein